MIERTKAKPEGKAYSMSSEYHREEMERMYKELTDPEEIQKNKARHERKKRFADKKSDTGL